MARKSGKDEEKLNYAAEIRALRAHGPGRLYFLWGPEDYLREQYLMQLKKICLPDGEEEDSFSYRRLEGPELDVTAFREALDALPFLTEKSFVELRDVDINKLEEADRYVELIGDIPDYCTVAFIQNSGFEPDGRTKFIKTLREKGKEIRFTRQPQGLLTDWIVRRFAAAGKGIELAAAQRLIFLSGDLMNRLIPEIEKIAAYARGDKVTSADVDAVASHIPEASVFEMTDFLAQKRFNAAMEVLAELLADKNNEPIMILSLLGRQMRQLYAARLALEKKLGGDYVTEVCALRFDHVAGKLMNMARGYSLAQLRHAVTLCAETDYQMKSSGGDTRELLKETVLRIATGESHAPD